VKAESTGGRSELGLRGTKGKGMCVCLCAVYGASLLLEFRLEKCGDASPHLKVTTVILNERHNQSIN